MTRHGFTFYRRPTKLRRELWKGYSGKIDCPDCGEKIYHSTDMSGDWSNCLHCGVVVFVPPFSELLKKTIKTKEAKA